MTPRFRNQQYPLVYIYEEKMAQLKADEQRKKQ